MLLKGMVVGASLALCVAAVVAPFGVAPSIAVVAEPHHKPVAEPQPSPAPAASAPQRQIVSVRTIECEEWGCSCGSERWAWSDGSPLTALDRARLGPAPGELVENPLSPLLEGAGTD
jgi:hypothetical protein